MCHCEGYGFQAIISVCDRLMILENLSLEYGIISQETESDQLLVEALNLDQGNRGS